MTHFPDSDENLVYSTDSGRIKQQQSEPSASSYTDGIVRIKRETKGRKGKGVTTVTGIDSQEHDLKKLAGNLKKRCGTGGGLKNGIIEIQGDKRDTIKTELEKLGFTVKLAGG